MKKRYMLLWIPVAATALLLLLYALSFQKVRLEAGCAGAIVYRYDGVSFEEPLTREETAAAAQIIGGKKLAPQGMTGIPSCGFSVDVAIVLGERRFLIARDTCCIMQDGETQRFFELSQEERRILDEIFAAHGGIFPCI